MKAYLGCYIELECRLSYMNFIITTMTFPFNFIAHRYFDAHIRHWLAFYVKMYSRW